MVDYVLRKVKVYPRPHHFKNMFKLSTTDANKDATIYPIVMQDEGLGDPSSYNAHPQHASFAEAAEPNTYPDSHISKAFVSINMTLTKHCWNTDKMEQLRVLVAPIYTAFKEDTEAADEGSTLTIADIVELQKESTDRQVYPLFNGTKLDGDSLALGSNVPGLTTNTNIEGIDIGMGTIYDAFQYYSNKEKLGQVIGPLRWWTIGRNKPAHIKMKTFIKPKVKAQNPYTFAGLLFYLPSPASEHQFGQANDDSATDAQLMVKVLVRYNEYNDNFDMTRV